MRSRYLVLPLMLVSLSAWAEGGKAEVADLALVTMTEQPASLSDYLGKSVTLVNFWATWCKACKNELPHLQALYEKYKDRGFTVVGISIDKPKDYVRVPRDVRTLRLTFPVLLDKQSDAVKRFNPRGDAPFSVLIDQDGRIVSSRSGFNPGDEVELEKAIVELLDKAGAAGAAVKDEKAPRASE